MVGNKLQQADQANFSKLFTKVGLTKKSWLIFLKYTPLLFFLLTGLISINIYFNLIFLSNLSLFFTSTFKARVSFFPRFINNIYFCKKTRFFESKINANLTFEQINGIIEHIFVCFLIVKMINATKIRKNIKL